MLWGERQVSCPLRRPALSFSQGPGEGRMGCCSLEALSRPCEDKGRNKTQRVAVAIVAFLRTAI